MEQEIESGIKKRKIPDILLVTRFTKLPESRIHMEKASPSERRIVRRSEDYTNPMAIAVGTIVRSAIDIGRYERTLRSNPELTDDQRAHIARQISAASVHATICTNNLAAESGSPMTFINEVNTRVSKVNWENVPDAKIPVITSEIPVSGTEYPHNIAFRNQVDEDRAQIPA